LGSVDRHARLTRVAAGGVIVAGALAVFGLPPIDLHGPLHYLGVMDPACGMTRAVRFLARGRVAEAWRYNPGSFVLATWAVVMLARHFVGQMTGRWLDVAVRNRRLLHAVAVVAVVALWINQQSHASMLMAHSHAPWIIRFL
jgi:hypothetical protein